MKKIILKYSSHPLPEFSMVVFVPIKFTPCSLSHLPVPFHSLSCIVISFGAANVYIGLPVKQKESCLSISGRRTAT